MVTIENATKLHCFMNQNVGFLTTQEETHTDMKIKFSARLKEDAMLLLVTETF
jgi:hypothetical protein